MTATIHLHRAQGGGAYTVPHPTDADRQYRIERGWFDERTTDRRRQTWTLMVVTADAAGDARADLLADFLTLRDARAELARLLLTT